MSKNRLYFGVAYSGRPVWFTLGQSSRARAWSTCIPLAKSVSGAVSLTFILQFADCMKVFWEITSISDCHKLHEDVKGILLWCDENHVVLNRSTTTLDTCSCKTSVMFFSYKLSSRHLSHVSNILVLAMFFSYSKPLFNIRIEMISSHAMQTS